VTKRVSRKKRFRKGDKRKKRKHRWGSEIPPSAEKKNDRDIAKTTMLGMNETKWRGSFPTGKKPELLASRKKGQREKRGNQRIKTHLDPGKRLKSSEKRGKNDGKEIILRKKSTNRIWWVEKEHRENEGCAVFQSKPTGWCGRGGTSPAPEGRGGKNDKIVKGKRLGHQRPCIQLNTQGA